MPEWPFRLKCCLLTKSKRCRSVQRTPAITTAFIANVNAVVLSFKICCISLFPFVFVALRTIQSLHQESLYTKDCRSCLEAMSWHFTTYFIPHVQHFVRRICPTYALQHLTCPGQSSTLNWALHWTSLPLKSSLNLTLSGKPRSWTPLLNIWGYDHYQVVSTYFDSKAVLNIDCVRLNTRRCALLDCISCPWLARFMVVLSSISSRMMKLQFAQTNEAPHACIIDWNGLTACRYEAKFWCWWISSMCSCCISWWWSLVDNHI